MAKGHTELRRFLSSRTAAHLVEEIIILYDRFPSVRDYFDGRVNVDARAQLFARHVRQIEREFSVGSRNPTGRPSKGREILRAFKQAAVLNEDVVQLTLFYASAVLAFMREFGIDEYRYYRTVESAFVEAAEITVKHGLEVELAGAFQHVLEKALQTSDDFAYELRDIANRYGVAEETQPNSA
jgi:hypothetical protein